MEFISSETYDDLLRNLISAVPEVKAAILVSSEGLPLSSILPEDVDELKIAGIITALLLMSNKLINEIKKEDFEQLSLNANGGYLIGVKANNKKLLMVLATKYIKLNLILKDLWEIG